MKRVRHYRGRQEPNPSLSTPRRHETRSHSVKTSKPYGTLIRERKDGVLYFSAKDDKGVSRHWTVTLEGKKWLAGQGIRPGKRAPGQVITALISKRHALASDNASAGQPKHRTSMKRKLEKLVHDTRRFEQRRAVDRESMQSGTPRLMSEPE